MKTIHLYGHMLEKFGGPFTLDVETPAEAARALCVQLPGFEVEIKKANWHVIRGPLDDADYVGESALQMTLGQQNEVHIIPVIAGAGSGGGLGMIVVGAIFIAAAFFTGGASIAAWSTIATMMGAAGLGMVVGGLIAMTMKAPGAADTSSGVTEDEKASFLFDGPGNQTKQGGAVPRGYGRLLVGSIVVSSGLYTEEIPA